MSYCLTSKLCWLERNSNLPPKFEIDCLSTCQLDANHSDAHLIQDFVFVPFDAPSLRGNHSNLILPPRRISDGACAGTSHRRRRLINGGGHSTLYARCCGWNLWYIITQLPSSRPKPGSFTCRTCRMMLSEHFLKFVDTKQARQTLEMPLFGHLESPAEFQV